MASRKSPAPQGLSPAVRALVDDIVAVRRDIHRNPELGFQEKRTSQVVEERLRKIGLDVERVAGTGVVGLIRGGKPGKTLLVRADMDALPLQEQNKTAYCSQVANTMHACGHDGHVSAALAAARVLFDERAKLKGNVKFMFQPAEEGPGGAMPMIKAGLLKGPKVDAAVALHVWNDLPVGTIGVRPGPIMAAADEIRITICGKGGHGAAPHQAIDPVVVAAHVITALQTIVSRQVDPVHSVVVTIASVHAGKAFNIIPPEVELLGTVRSFDKGVRAELPERIERLVRGVTSAFGAGYRMRYKHGYPPTVNDKRMSEFVKGCASQLPCVREVVEADVSLGGEDMAYVLEKVPGCYFFLGSSNESKGITSPHHSPTFDIDEACLPIGTEVFCEVARRFLG
ncbi:MAG: amidohydrolase [Candidatus Wallbacteria bacterium]|nr:amidohydrolase [Candidatus Wallbacteria bacterium]